MHLPAASLHGHSYRRRHAIAYYRRDVRGLGSLEESLDGAIAVGLLRLLQHGGADWGVAAPTQAGVVQKHRRSGRRDGQVRLCDMAFRRMGLYALGAMLDFQVVAVLYRHPRSLFLPWWAKL